MIDEICEKEMEEIDSILATAMQTDNCQKFMRVSGKLNKKSKLRRRLNKALITTATLASLLFPVASSRTQDLDVDLINREKVLLQEQRYSVSETEKIFETGIFDVMIHLLGENSKFGPQARIYNITPDNLWKTFEMLHENNYIPISLREYIEHDLSAVPKGKWPILLTLDDSAEGQFKYILDEKGMPKEIDPDCFVGMFMKFSHEHPDFRMKAVFFPNYTGNPKYSPYSTFRQKSEAFEKEHSKTLEEFKLENLIKLGFDLGDHTYSHINASTSDKRTLEDFKKSKKELENYIPENYPFVIAWPYGVPASKKAIEELKKEGYVGAFIAAGGIAKGEPNDNFYIPRVDIKSLKLAVVNQKKDPVFALFTSEKQEVAKAHKIGGENEQPKQLHDPGISESNDFLHNELGLELNNYIMPAKNEAKAAAQPYKQKESKSTFKDRTSSAGASLKNSVQAAYSSTHSFLKKDVEQTISDFKSAGNRIRDIYSNATQFMKKNSVKVATVAALAGAMLLPTVASLQRQKPKAEPQLKQITSSRTGLASAVISKANYAKKEANTNKSLNANSTAKINLSDFLQKSDRAQAEANLDYFGIGPRLEGIKRIVYCKNECNKSIDRVIENASVGWIDNRETAYNALKAGVNISLTLNRYDTNVATDEMKQEIIKEYSLNTDKGLVTIAKNISKKYGINISASTIRRHSKKVLGSNVNRGDGSAKQAYIRKFS